MGSFVGRGGKCSGCWLAAEFRPILPEQREGGASWKDGSQQRLSSASLREKTCSPSVHVHCMEANTLVMVQQLILLTAVPGRVRTNCKLRRAIKCVFLTSCS